MNKIIFYIFPLMLILFTILFASDFIHYKKIGDNIYYFENKPLEDVDIKTFRELKNPTGFRYYSAAASDKNAFYVYGNKIPFTNAHKVRIISAFNYGYCLYIFEYKNKIYRLYQIYETCETNYKPQVEYINLPQKMSAKKLFCYKPQEDDLIPVYFSDYKNIYYFNINELEFIHLKGLDAKKFRAYGLSYKGDYYWGTDGKLVYLNDIPLKGVDPSTFTCLGAGYFKDKNKVYYFSSSDQSVSIIKEADTKTFVLVKGRMIDAVDKNYQYYCGKIIYKYKK